MDDRQKEWFHPSAPWVTNEFSVLTYRESTGDNEEPTEVLVTLKQLHHGTISPQMDDDFPTAAEMGCQLQLTYILLCRLQKLPRPQDHGRLS